MQKGNIIDFSAYRNERVKQKKRNSPVSQELIVAIQTLIARLRDYDEKEALTLKDQVLLAQERRS